MSYEVKQSLIDLQAKLSAARERCAAKDARISQLEAEIDQLKQIWREHIDTAAKLAAAMRVVEAARSGILDNPLIESFRFVGIRDALAAFDREAGGER